MNQLSPELTAAFANDSLTNWQVSEQFNLAYDWVVRNRAKWRRLHGLEPLRKGRKPLLDEITTSGLNMTELRHDFENPTLTINEIVDKYEAYDLKWDWVQTARKAHRDSIGWDPNQVQREMVRVQAPRAHAEASEERLNDLLNRFETDLAKLEKIVEAYFNEQ
jgi:hypothetical protein